MALGMCESGVGKMAGVGPLGVAGHSEKLRAGIEKKLKLN